MNKCYSENKICRFNLLTISLMADELVAREKNRDLAKEMFALALWVELTKYRGYPPGFSLIIANSLFRITTEIIDERHQNDEECDRLWNIANDLFNKMELNPFKDVYEPTKEDAAQKAANAGSSQDIS